MDSKQIGIIGQGFLGTAVAKRLEKDSHTLWATQSRSDLNIYDEPESWPEVPELDWALLFVPFSRRLENPWDYSHGIDTLCAYIRDKAPSCQILLSSSTSIYPEDNQLAKEDDTLPLNTERQKALAAAESHCDHVIRYGGLIGGTRDADYLRQRFKPDRPPANTPANLIHVDDAAGIVAWIIQNNLDADIWNAVTTEHPHRRDFYLSIGAPYPDLPKETPYKIVSNEKVLSVGYPFIHQDPLRFF